MQARLAALAFLAMTASGLSGCGEVGMCSKTSLGSDDSPGGQYSVEIVHARCLASAPADWVILQKTSGFLRERKIVAIFDASSDKSDKVKARWATDRLLYVRDRGANVWSFQPYWRDVEIEDK